MALNAGFITCSCKDADEESKIVCTFCEDKEIIKILENEPAFVAKRCFEHIGRVDAFTFDLVNTHTEFIGIFPCGEIPEKFKKEGLSVRISGNVTNCSVVGGCVEPNIKLAEVKLFELKFITDND